MKMPKSTFETTNQSNACLCQPHIASEVSRLLRGLGNTQRLMVVALLHETGEMHVSGMVEKLQVSRAALSRHLTHLRELRVVRTRRDQNRIYYTLDHDKARTIVQSLLV